MNDVKNLSSPFSQDLELISNSECKISSKSTVLYDLLYYDDPVQYIPDKPIL